MEKEFFFGVLDKGFVELYDSMGDDLRAVESARVSFQKGLSDEKRDRDLIDYLMAHGHESPFEHIVFTFRVKAPLFVARQWLRHRIASINEVSQRYSVVKEEFYIPDHVRIKDEVNRQGSVVTDDEELSEDFIGCIEKHSKAAYEEYRKLLEKGVAREMARIILPTNMYTMWFWTVNARSLMNFLSLRADSHAQYEIQQYALKMGEIFRNVCPWTYEAFLRYNYKGDLLKV